MTSNQPWWLTWPVAEVAAATLPMFAIPQWSPFVSELQAMVDIDWWCRTGSYQKKSTSGRKSLMRFDNPDFRAVAEAMQVLEHSGLLMKDPGNGGPTGGFVGLTRLGMQALQTNTVRQHLGLSDAPPTA